MLEAEPFLVSPPLLRHVVPLNEVKQGKMLTMNLRTSLKIMLFILRSMDHRISLKCCQWMSWKLWCHASAFLTHEITWRQAYVAWLSTLLWKNWCQFPPKSPQWLPTNDTLHYQCGLDIVTNILLRALTFDDSFTKMTLNQPDHLLVLS